MNGAEILESLKWRYATKMFDPSRKISEEHWSVLQSALVLAPSSYGLQPWKFVVVTRQSLKDQLPTAAWNQTQPKDCSHFIVIAARKTTDSGFVQSLISAMAKERGVPESSLEGYRQAILSKSEGMPGGHLEWNARQCYIALGFLLESAALLGIDGCPMEGIVRDRMDELLGLTDSEYTSVVACALGYRSETDKYAAQKKVRFAADQVVMRIS